MLVERLTRHNYINEILLLFRYGEKPMKDFLNAVIYGGIALFVGTILGLFIEGALDQFEPQQYETEGDNSTNETAEWQEYDGSLTQLAVNYFLPSYMVSLVIGVILMIVVVVEQVGN